MPFQVMSLTDAAVERIQALLASADPDVQGLRVGLKNAGCAGMEYTVDYVRDPDPKDDVVSEKGVTVYVDPKAVLFMLGTQMDYEVTKLRSGFVFNNPNQTGACGCGESVSLQAADLEALAKEQAAQQ
ncbi:Fe-S cluster assembly scaffold SufA [Coralliovum pocilloporae]|uniref:Fe-S cluster assembly scaffold SufA n=1 Tax=Coralliovum pocilloporae TaxID=3066369 RepID=UPI0033070578